MAFCLDGTIVDPKLQPSLECTSYNTALNSHALIVKCYFRSFGVERLKNNELQNQRFNRVRIQAIARYIIYKVYIYDKNSKYVDLVRACTKFFVFVSSLFLVMTTAFYAFYMFC